MEEPNYNAALAATFVAVYALQRGASFGHLPNYAEPGTAAHKMAAAINSLHEVVQTIIAEGRKAGQIK